MSRKGKTSNRGETEISKVEGGFQVQLEVAGTERQRVG